MVMAYDGSYSVFIFILSIYATLSFLYLHRVEIATAINGWFKFYSPLLVSSSVAVDDVTMVRSSFAAMSRRLWDPGIRSTARFIWDPGGMSPPVDGFDRPPAPLHASIGLMSPSPIDLTPWLSCQVNEESKRHASIESIRCDPSVDGAAPTVDRDPFLLRPIRPMVSMFKYCHPVLSRPTVPNIISNII